VRLAHSCAMGGEDVVGEVKGIDELGLYNRESPPMGGGLIILINISMLFSGIHMLCRSANERLQ